MTFGVVSETDNLRLRIVQMVRGQGRDVRSKPPSGQLDLKFRDGVEKPEEGGHSVGRDGPNQQGQGIFDLDNDRILGTQHPAPPSAYSSKSRAAAWLIRRFHRRQDRHTDSSQQSRNVKFGKSTGQENGQNVNHLFDLSRCKSRNLDPILDDAIKKQEFDHFLISTERKRLLEAHLANLKSDLKSNGTTLGNITSDTGNVNVFKGVNNVNYDPRKDKPRGVNKLQDICPPEPVFLKHDRRKGIFSASLENFKRRLHMASNKVGVLDEGKENITEKDSVNLGYLPLKHVPRPPTQPRDAHVKPDSGKKSRTETGKINVIHTPAQPEHATAVKNDGGANYAEKTSNSMRPKSSGKETLRHEELQHSSDISRRLRKPLSRIGENEGGEISEALSAKSKKHGSPAPLTVHNLRVHDSMQSAQERRLKRLQPRPPTQLQLQQQGVEGAIFTPTPGDRMWQWLDEVKLEVPVAVLTLHSGREQMETPLLFKENFEIFV